MDNQLQFGDEPPCDGSGSCLASIHRHGCYADKGNCDSPGEHVDELAVLRERVSYLEEELARAQRRGRGSALSRSDDPAAAHIAASQVEDSEGNVFTLKPNTHKHLTLRVYALSYPEELTATEAGQKATPGHDRVTGGSRRTYDLRARGLVVRGRKGFTITRAGMGVLYRLDAGETVYLHDNHENGGES